MPDWTNAYYSTLIERFDAATENLEDLIADIVDGRSVPSLGDIRIGGAKRFSGTVMFFDLRSFSSRTNRDGKDVLSDTLYLLDSVMPVAMHAVYDFDGFIEKNTGDGIMALFGIDKSDKDGCKDAIECALTIQYAVKNLVNPHLESQLIDSIHWRIGIDSGDLLIAKIGVRKGSSEHPRSFLTAVGATANVASKIQHAAKTDHIWIGDRVRQNLTERRQGFCIDVTPSDWPWTYINSGDRYTVWRYNASWNDPE